MYVLKAKSTQKKDRVVRRIVINLFGAYFLSVKIKKKFKIREKANKAFAATNCRKFNNF